jgi:hypothetical protein
MLVSVNTSDGICLRGVLRLARCKTGFTYLMGRAFISGPDALTERTMKLRQRSDEGYGWRHLFRYFGFTISAK